MTYHATPTMLSGRTDCPCIICQTKAYILSSFSSFQEAYHLLTFLPFRITVKYSSYTIRRLFTSNCHNNFSLSSVLRYWLGIILKLWVLPAIIATAYVAWNTYSVQPVDWKFIAVLWQHMFASWNCNLWVFGYFSSFHYNR